MGPWYRQLETHIAFSMFLILGTNLWNIGTLQAKEVNQTSMHGQIGIDFMTFFMQSPNRVITFWALSQNKGRG